MSRGRMIIETDSGRNTKSFERRLSVNGRGRWKVEFSRPLSSRYIDFPCIPSSARANSKILLWEGGGGVGVNCSSNGTAISFPQLRTRLLAGRLSRVRIYNGDILVKTRVQKIQLLRDYRSFFSLQTGKKKWRGRVVKFSSREPQRFILRTKLSETKTRRNQRKECLFGLRFPPVAPFSLFRQSVKKKKERENHWIFNSCLHLSLRSIKLHKEQGNSPTKLTIDSPFPPIRVLHWIKVSRTIRKRERGTSGKQRVDASRVESFNVS